MNTKPMNCRQAKTEMALWVGDDLDEASARQVERHVAVCPECRDALVALRQSQSVLQALAGSKHAGDVDAALLKPASSNLVRLASDGFESLWPAVSRRLPGQSGARMRRFNGWLPAAAVMAACVAILVVTGQNAVQYFDGPAPFERPVFPATPAVESQIPNLPGFDDRGFEGRGMDNRIFQAPEGMDNRIFQVPDEEQPRIFKQVPLRPFDRP